MDGATALKFVRSRHAQGDEGTDFARSVRQQKVIAALKDKLISIQFWLSVQKWGKLLDIFQTYVKADPLLSGKETASFANLMLRFVRQKSVIRTLALDQGTEESPGFLVSPAIEKYGQWVLVPRTGNWLEIQEYFKQKISGSF
jgi:anionic cell wall polymer biosynthesis LytR-Cps2A-Psr (LCP) family protein